MRLLLILIQFLGSVGNPSRKLGNLLIEHLFMVLVYDVSLIN
jgi:hypothetical protein